MPLVIAGIVQDRGYFERLVEPRLDGERVSYVGPVGARPPRRPARRRASAAASRQLRRAVRLQRRRGDGLWHAGHRARRRGSMAEIVRHGENGFLVETSTRPSPPSTLRMRSTAQPCAHRSRIASTSSGWWTTTSPSIGASSSSTASADRQRGRPLSPSRGPSRFRVGVNYWPARTAMSWWSSFDPARGCGRLRADRRLRPRLGEGVPDLGRLPTGPDPRRPSDARAARRGRGSRRRRSGSRSSPRSSRVT